MECSIELSMYNRLYHRHGGHRRQAQGCKVSMCVVLCLAAGKVEIRVWGVRRQRWHELVKVHRW